MKKQKSIYSILVTVLLCLCLFVGGGFLSMRVAFADGTTPEITVYRIEYLDSDEAHTPLTVSNPETVSVADLPLVLENPTPTQTGYIFGYWGFNKDADLPTTRNDKYELTASDVREHAEGDLVKIYAYWELEEYSLAFSYSGVEYGTVTSATGFAELNNKVTATTNIDLTKPEYQPKCAGHEFLGWYSDPNYENKITRLTGITGDTRLYGKFAKLDYRITFADETLGLDSIAFRSGMDYAYDRNGQKGLLTNIVPKKDGYSFAGWYTTEDCREGTQVGKFYLFTAPVTLYAKWEKQPNAIWLYISGGCCVLITAGFVSWYAISKRKLKLY